VAAPPGFELYLKFACALNGRRGGTEGRPDDEIRPGQSQTAPGEFPGHS
jgi:hypothetical protein